ncbi:hypothetical protein TM1040_2254 [Ruegeria sp. TM1040]|uniref:hypothetical protein n=1 Tax=Ruegeria sp. (strain TM1040) TaxID=292414 RepID=UPI0000555597|nr:hypothetical protein [Ruegeria sp. TM1040]ABF64986.1 hypothetical protein TM1040_2254 [Ruegeria sp. TM1040]
MSDIDAFFHNEQGNYTVDDGGRKAVLKIFLILLASSLIAIPLMSGDHFSQKRSVLFFLSPFLFLAAWSTWASLKKVHHVVVHEDKVEILPLGLAFYKKDLVAAGIRSFGKQERLIELKTFRWSFKYYMRSLVWIGNCVSIPIER